MTLPPGDPTDAGARVDPVVRGYWRRGLLTILRAPGPTHKPRPICETALRRFKKSLLSAVPHGLGGLSQPRRWSPDRGASDVLVRQKTGPMAEDRAAGLGRHEGCRRVSGLRRLQAETSAPKVKNDARDPTSRRSTQRASGHRTTRAPSCCSSRARGLETAIPGSRDRYTRSNSSWGSPGVTSTPWSPTNTLISLRTPNRPGR